MHRYHVHRTLIQLQLALVLAALVSTVLGFSRSPSSLSGKEPINGAFSGRYAFDVDHEGVISTTRLREDEVQVGGPTSNRHRRRPSKSSVAYFETRFQELLEYRNVHGHTRVPKREGQLGDWVNKLRQRKDQLHEKRIEQLNEIEFCWDASDDKRRRLQNQWWKQLESLRKTQTEAEQKSSILVYDNLAGSQKAWLRRQRIVYIDSSYKPCEKLNEEQIQALNRMDRNWWKTARERKWDAQYSALRDFKRKYGHCNVSSACKDKKLFNW